MNPSQLIDNQIKGLPDWRGELFTKLRKIVLTAAPDITEEWKWDTAVWTQNGLVCAVGSFKDHLKINFMKGAFLPDPEKLFNAGLEAKSSRAIDFYEGDTINEAALAKLISVAVAFNAEKKK